MDQLQQKSKWTKKEREQRAKWKAELELIKMIVADNSGEKTRTIAKRELWLNLKLYGKEQPKVVNRGVAVTRYGTFGMKSYK